METNKGQIKILIADTSEKTREEIKAYFENKTSFQIVGETSDGAEALSKINETEIDVLIMDIVLSGIDGFGVLEQIKKDNKKIKPIVISSLSHHGFVSKALELGASTFMVKPFLMEGLESTINEVLSEPIKSFGMAQRGKPFNRVLEEKISNIFITVGIPAHIKGYQFLREAIKLAIDTPDIINSITKKLYPSIAEKFETSSSKVERAIRHAIEVAWNRGKIENINNLFGLKVYGSNEKPTNGEFIALVADKMLIEGA
ncbi:MAG: sporulation transcription factor Spo0A [Clostridia bacterium]